MVFKKRKFSSTEEILELMKSDTEIMGSTAVIYFHRSDKVSGKLYMRKGAEKGLVYAAHVSNMPFHIGKRLKPHLTEEQYDEVLRQVGGDDTDPNIARLVVTKQFVGEKIVDAYIREYLFAAASEIFSWQEVIAKWENGTETRDFASKQYIRLDLLQKKAVIRDTQYRTMVQDIRLEEEQIDKLKVLRNGDLEHFAAIENKNLQIILKFADGKHTVEQLREETGLLKIPAFMGIHALWNTGHIKLLAGDIPVYPPNVTVEEPAKEPEEEPEEVIDFAEETPEYVEETQEDRVGTLDEIKDSSPIEDKDFDEPEEEPEALEEEPEPIEEDEESEVIEEGPEASDDWIVGEIVNSDEEFDEEPISGIVLPDLHTSDEDDEPVLDFHLEEEKVNEIEEKPMNANPPSAIIVEAPGAGMLGKLNERISALQNASMEAHNKITESESSFAHFDADIEALEAKIQQVKDNKSQAAKKHQTLIEEEKAITSKLEKIIQTINDLTAS